MLPQTRPHPLPDRRAAPLHVPCLERAVALDLLHAFSLSDACNVELWLDRIEARLGREARP